MDSTIKLGVLMCVGYVLSGSVIFPVEHIRPRILNNTHGETIVNANGNLTLRCEGTSPVVWKFPNETYQDNFYSVVDVHVWENSKASLYKYGAVLKLINASFVDTGFFYCHENVSDIEDPERSDKIYVFVRDEEHLMASPTAFGFLRTNQFTNITIPCRPTSPDITVELLDSNMEKISHIISFDPKYGFLIQVNSLIDSGEYICSYRGEHSEENEFNLYVNPYTSSVAKPHISTSNNLNRTAVGEQYYLKCVVHVEENVQFDLSWDIPNKSGLQTERIIESKTLMSRDNQEMGTKYLNISRVELEDAGEYTCTVKDNNNNVNNHTKTITVIGLNVSYINIVEKHNIYHISESVGESIKWVITVDSHPKARLIWINNQNQEIQTHYTDTNTNKYVIIPNIADIIFKINNINLNDSGTYIVKASNTYTEKELKLHLTVLDKPTVRIENTDFHLYGEESQVTCIAVGNPVPTIIWSFKSCHDDSCQFVDFTEKNYSTINLNMKSTSVLHLVAYQSGYLQCKAINKIGQDSNTIGFYVTDVDKGFDIWSSDKHDLKNNYDVAVGDKLTFYCAASVYNYTEDIQWFKRITNHTEEENDIIIIKSNDRFSFRKHRTKFTHRLVLLISNITKNEAGVYGCKATSKDDNFPMYHEFKINVQEPRKPNITRSNMNGTVTKLKMGTPWRWICEAEGVPAPTITWTKDGKDWSIGANYSHVQLLQDNTILDFKFLQQDDEGEYACRASNWKGSDERKMALMLIDKPGPNSVIIGILIFVSLIFLAAVIFLAIKVRKEKKLRDELKIAGLMNFEKGALGSLNPELGVDDQAELLPYEQKWEFPRDKLKLGKQLGSGAFGVVMKAEAMGILEEEPVTTVAVKMVKRNADYTYIKALASELKIMVHLGKNLNVVNLLGACTKNVAKRELLVIVEYCRFGNLHNYLLRHRQNFIDQIDSKTGKIDANIGGDILARTMSVGSTNSQLKYASLAFANSSTRGAVACAGVDYRYTPNPSSNDTDTNACTSLNSAGDDTYILSNNSAQPEWRSNYHGDYNKGNVRPILTSDLLCWAFQVSRGMEYLASRKVLHGDLAARNILLTEENVVKICDFGLAKSMYKNDNYKKKGDGPLPVKWMAIESIRDRVFSTQSDVWSYGIVLWEFFSLAHSPYPGMDADERLYHKLVDGYRMDQPEYATKEIYQLMLQCWHAKPTCRPSFTCLAEQLGSMLNVSVRNYYIDLNNPYLEMNNQWLQQGHNDYLAMLSPPDYGNLSSPKPEYENDVIFTEEKPQSETSGYLVMKPSLNIFSPRDTDNQIFDFEMHKRKKSNGEAVSGIELVPMLHLVNDFSDNEISPTLPKNFTNPSYQNPPVLHDTERNIVKTTDNYINMPQQKEIIKNEKQPGIDNPAKSSYTKITDPKTLLENEYGDNDSNKHYVNSQSRDWERPYVS